MDRKYADIMEAFENCRFEDCLRQIDQLLKKIEKQDSKKKQQLSEKEMTSMQIVRVGSLAAIGELHQASHILHSNFQNPPIAEDLSFLFLQICTMAMDRRLPTFTSIIEEGKDKQKIDISRFLLLNSSFSTLSRSFLRSYMTEKKHEDGLAQIYLEYLQQAHLNSMIRFDRDRIIPESKEMNLKMVSMFLTKFLVSFKAVMEKEEEEALQRARVAKLNRAAADLLLRIAINEGNSSAARALFQEWSDSVRDNAFCYLRSILAMSSERKENLIFWVR